MKMMLGSSSYLLFFSILLLSSSAEDPAALLIEGKSPPADDGGGCLKPIVCAGSIVIGASCEESGFGPVGKIQPVPLLGAICFQCPGKGNVTPDAFPYAQCERRPLCMNLSDPSPRVILPGQTKCILANPQAFLTCIATCPPNLKGLGGSSDQDYPPFPVWTPLPTTMGAPTPSGRTGPSPSSDPDLDLSPFMAPTPSRGDDDSSSITLERRILTPRVIAGITVGVALVVILIASYIWHATRRARGKKEEEEAFERSPEAEAQHPAIAFSSTEVPQQHITTTTGEGARQQQPVYQRPQLQAAGM